MYTNMVIFTCNSIYKLLMKYFKFLSYKTSKIQLPLILHLDETLERLSGQVRLTTAEWDSAGLDKGLCRAIILQVLIKYIMSRSVVNK